MARPQKEGLEYFPLDVDMDQDDKIALIEAQHGLMGFGVVIKLLMKIYKHGYFYEWTEKQQLLFSKRVNVDSNLINVIINDCVKWELFDKNAFESYKVLTSRGIQKRYLEAVGRRQKVKIYKEYLLLDNETINVHKNLIIVDINPNKEVVNADINPQSKVKESKVDNTTTPTIEDEPVDNVDKSNYIDFFNNNFGHLITTFEVETLEGYIEDGIEPDVIILALQEAVEANIRDMRYVKKVLDRWKNNKITTVEAVMADKRDFELKVKQQSENKAQGRSAANYNKKKSTSNNFKGRNYSKDQIKDLESKLLGLEDGG
ncbi:Lin1244/Lin1753 domain-containing protein [Clostridium sp. WILCCON 0269]|uniref:Lin1244/Lin1753 domain-containing protein n=1 Tax=Candidatus Clostridium eludens TaxID=3381663 RepID=A0ABW8SMX7_9CLOT